MDQQPLELNRRYIVKHTSQSVPAIIASLDHRVNIATLVHEQAQTLQLNDIGGITLQFLRPIALDRYSSNRATGSFILIDPQSNAAVAAGMVTNIAEIDSKDAVDAWGPVTANERAARRGHRGAVLEISAPAELVDSLERSLFSIGAVTTRLNADDNVFVLHPSLLELAAQLNANSGVLAIVAHNTRGEQAAVIVEGRKLTFDAREPDRTIAAIHQLLSQANVFYSHERAGL